jgi:sucrose-6-phosphate hydrolase SacC (GH32 family)
MTSLMTPSHIEHQSIHTFKANNYTTVELFVERDCAGDSPTDHRKAGVAIVSNETGERQETFLDSAQRRSHVALPLDGSSSYALLTTHARITYSYLSGGPDLLERGVLFLDVQGIDTDAASDRNPEGRIVADCDDTWLEHNVESADNLATFYEHYNRPRSHFEPFEHWMNDPNGLCRFQGKYHMFYQFNPYGWNWDNMHWGHAVSSDLIHWTHLPIVLFPQPELHEGTDHSGGAFSGSAVPIDAQGKPCAGDDAVAMQFFLTRHMERHGDPSSLIEYQTTCVCSDGITFGPEHPVVLRPVSTEDFSQLGLDFRDPKVEWRFPGDDTTMVIASNISKHSVSQQHYNFMWSPISDLQKGWHANEPSDNPGDVIADTDRVPALALFTADKHSSMSKQDDWQYQGITFADTEHTDAFTFECPDFFPLDGSDVVVAALMKYRDGGGRYQPVMWYTGSIHAQDNAITQDSSAGANDASTKFMASQSGLCDFGSGYYAVQSFQDDRNRRIAIGWISDWFETKTEGKHLANGVMSLPRQLHIRNGRLLSRPVQEVYDVLLGSTIVQRTFENALLETSSALNDVTIPIPDNAYYANIELSNDADFDIIIALDEQGHDLHLVRSSGITEVLTHGSHTDALHLHAGISDIRKIEIFYDRGVAEIFLNDGEAAGAVLSACAGENGTFMMSHAADQQSVTLELRKLNSIWS